MEWAGGRGGWVREATEVALKERAGFQEGEPGVIGGRPARCWGEASRVNCSQRRKGTGHWAGAFK